MRPVVCTLTAIAMLHFDSLPARGAALSVDEVIAALEAAEDRSARFVFAFEFNSMKLADPADPASVTETLPTYVRGTVYYDVATGRYLFESESVSKWVDGAAPYIAERNGWSYDGRVYRHWHRTRHGQTLPSIDEPADVDGGQVGPLVGEITTAEDAAGFVRALTRQSGLSNFPPFVDVLDTLGGGEQFALTTLSEELQARQVEGQTIHVEEEPAGTWRIAVPARDAPKKEEIRLWVDPARGCVVTRIEWVELNVPAHVVAKWTGKTPPGNLPSELPYRRLQIVLHEAESGRWVPKELNLVEVLSKHCRRIRLTDIELNPALTDEDFRVRFPVGTQVDDFIEEKSYRVSAGPVAEAEAVREFILRHKVPPVSRPPLAPSQSWLWVIAANVLAVGGIVLVVLWRRRTSSSNDRTPGNTTPLLLLSILTSVSSADAAEFQPRYGWTTGHAPGEQIPISQCGFNVVVFALELCEARYEAEPLAAVLRPGKDGIVMNDLKTALEACGLRVEARADVRMAELNRSLTSSQVAIVPLRFRDGRGHYIAALRDKTGRLLLADPPHSLIAATAAIFREAEFAGPRPVLFVSPRDPRAPALASQLQVIPATIDLGEFVLNTLDDQSDLNVELSLRNAATAPLLVNAVRTSCGCTTVGWQGGVLAPGQEQRVTLRVHRIGWGEGLRQRLVTVELADGSRRQITLTGHGRREQAHLGMSVSSSRIVHEIDYPLSVPYRRVVEAPCGSRLEPIDSLNVVVGDRWLRAALHPEDSQRLEATIELDEPLLRSLMRGARRITGQIHAAHGDRRLQVVQIDVVLPARLDVSPRVVSIAQGDVGRVRIISLDKQVVIRGVAAIHISPPCVDCKVVEVNKSGVLLECRATASAAATIVSCEIDCGDPIPEVVSFVGRVIDGASLTGL